MSGSQLRDQAIQQQTDRNPETISMFLRELGWMRSQRLAHKSTWDEVFTCEQIIKDAQRRIYLQAPTSLYGAIGKLVRNKGLIAETGDWISAERDSRHSNRSPVCCWQP